MDATIPPVEAAFDNLIKKHAPRHATDPCACGYCSKNVPALAVRLAYNYALRNELRPEGRAGIDALDELETARALLDLLIESLRSDPDYAARRELTAKTWQPLWDSVKARHPGGVK